MGFRKLIDSVKSCFGVQSSKVHPRSVLLEYPTLQENPELHYSWYGCPTATCCRDIYRACKKGHLDCLKEIVEYELTIFSKEKVEYLQSRTCPYFCWMAENGTVEMFRYLISKGYSPSWSHFFSEMIRCHNLDLLKSIQEDTKDKWLLSHIYSYFFFENIREGDLDDYRVTETFLYFLNHGSLEEFSLFSATFYILDIVKRGISKIPVERFDDLPQAKQLILESLAMAAPLKNPNNLFDPKNFVETYQPIFDKIIDMKNRKVDIVYDIIQTDIITKDVVLYVVSKYIPYAY